MHRRDTVAQLSKLTPFDTAVNRLPQSPEDSLIHSAEDRLTDCNQLSQLLSSSRTDSDDNSLDISLPEIPVEWNLCS